jgi:hypothetical protein
VESYVAVFDRRRLLVVVVPAVAASIAMSPVASATPAPPGQQVSELFRFQDPAVVESSGVASSSRRDDVVYTHNDSGDRARFFGVDGRGCTIATYTLRDADAVDWEDMAAARDRSGRGRLWFGDIGDNFSARSEGVTVYRVDEPKPTPRSGAAGGGCAASAERQLRATRFDLRYADGPHDAETLLVQPGTQRIFVVTKDLTGANAVIYAAPRRLERGTVQVLERVAEVTLPPGTPDPGVITGGDISRDGKRLVLRTYTEAFEWEIPDGDLRAALATTLTRIALPKTPQGEAIAYTRRGDALITTSEKPPGTDPPVYQIRQR